MWGQYSILLSLVAIILLLPTSKPTRCRNGLFVGVLLFNIRGLFTKAFRNRIFACAEEIILAIAVEIGYACFGYFLFLRSDAHTLFVQLFLVKVCRLCLKCAISLHLLLNSVLVGVAFEAVVFKSEHIDANLLHFVGKAVNDGKYTLDKIFDSLHNIA